MVPLIFSVVYQYKLPAVYTGLPMLAALSVTHGFLPPHPSPTALVAQFNANLGVTLLYGCIVAIPTIILAGPIFAKTLKNIRSVPLQTFQPKDIPESKQPGTANSFFSSLLPVMILLITTVLIFMVPGDTTSGKVLRFLGDPVIVMLFSLLIVTMTLGTAQGIPMQKIMNHYGESIKDIALILLIVAGAGALKQVFTDSGISAQIGLLLQDSTLHPLVLGWTIAALIRVCIGSATVAGLTTAGIIAPVIPASGVDPNLMVLSIGAGSLMFSHVNDSGFWLFKEYFNLSIKDTIRSWSLMETIVAIGGLIGVLVLSLWI
jgi:Gnt-I system high-affinity gluconate transporter